MKITEIIEKLCSSPNIASQKPIFEKYDKNVQGNTARERGDTIASIILPFRDFTELSEKESQIGVAISTGGNPNIAKISARIAAENAITEAALKIAMVGGDFLGATDCLNFGNPEKPEQMGEFVDAIDGIKKACDYLQIPIVSGNVSFYNESAGRSIPPSAIVSVFGRVKDAKKSPSISFQKAKASIFLIGPRNENLGGSEFLKMMEKEDSRVPEINLKSVKIWISALKKCVQDNEISSANFVGRGGLLMALLTSSFGKKIGLKIEVPKTWPEAKITQFLFGETPGVIITTTKPDEIEKAFGDQALQIGDTCSDFGMKILHDNVEICEVNLDQYKKLWEEKLQTIF